MRIDVQARGIWCVESCQSSCPEDGERVITHAYNGICKGAWSFDGEEP